MKPQHVYIENGKATICGIPDADHNCDAMGCSSLEHVLCRTTFEQAPKPPAEWMRDAVEEIWQTPIRIPVAERSAGDLERNKQEHVSIIAKHAPKAPEGGK